MDWTQENGRPRNRSKTRRKREIRATISQLRRKLARNFKLVNSSRAIIWKICPFRTNIHILEYVDTQRGNGVTLTTAASERIAKSA